MVHASVRFTRQPPVPGQGATGGGLQTRGEGADHAADIGVVVLASLCEHRPHLVLDNGAELGVLAGHGPRDRGAESGEDRLPDVRLLADLGAAQRVVGYLTVPRGQPAATVVCAAPSRREAAYGEQAALHIGGSQKVDDLQRLGRVLAVGGDR